MDNNLRDKIWITCKTRMVSERRYRTYDTASHLFLTYMSVLMIAVSLFSDQIRSEIPYFDKVAIAIAVALFATTLVVSGFKFSDAANKHRECYLKLQYLDENFDTVADVAKKYNEILLNYPNHAQRDYETLVLNRTLFSSRNMKIGDEEITWSVWMLVGKLIRFAGFASLIIALPLSVTILFVTSILRHIEFL